jgi:TetR/AcrR family transcriptional regulator, transcriptional repressor for nem operon
MLKSVTGADVARRRGARGRDTREEILNAAEELWQRRGYNGFSYHHIAVQLEIRNAAIHYHFPAKENLGVALIQRYRSRFSEWFVQVRKIENAWERLQSYFNLYVEYLNAECRVCPSGILGAEFQAIPEEMRQEAKLLMGEIYDWLIETLELGRAQGSLQFVGKAEDKAVQLGASLQGGLQIARVAGAERLHQLLAQISLELFGQTRIAQAA